MSAQAKLEDLLKEASATLLRRGNHRVYQIQGVGRFVVPSSPSDGRAWDNSYARLMRLLGRKEKGFKKKRRFKERMHGRRDEKRAKRESNICNTTNTTSNVLAGGIRWKGEREP